MPKLYALILAATLCASTARAEEPQPPAAPPPAPAEAPTAPVPSPAPEPCPPPPPAAPVPRLVVEEAVPFDAAGVVMEIDAERAKELKLFEGHEGFRAARLFQVAPEGWALEIDAERKGAAYRTRELLDAAGLAELRGRVGSAFAARQPSALDQSGRPALLAATTALGLAAYGWTLQMPAGFKSDVAVGTYMLVAGGSFLVPWALTVNQPVSLASAHLAFYGGTRGLAHGLMLDLALAGEPPDKDWMFFTPGFVSLLELGGGYLWGRFEGLTVGQAHAIGVLGDYGLGMGLATSVLINPSVDRRLTSALGLVGSAAGIAGGRFLAGRRAYTWGDAEVAEAAGLIGLLGGAAVANVLDANGVRGDRPIAGCIVAGTTLGLVAGSLLVEGLDFTVGQAVLVDLGAVAGSAFGLGAAVLVGGSRFLLPAAALGSAAGYAGMYLLFRHSPELGVFASDVRLDLAPEGLVSALGLGRRGEAPAPLVRLGYGWE